MILFADIATYMTFGLVATFFVILPAIAHGAIIAAIGGALGERQDNLDDEQNSQALAGPK